VKIAFDKIGATPKAFQLTHQAMELTGDLHKTGAHQVELKGHMRGTIELQCDRCGTLYRHDVDEPLALRITDAVAQDKEDLDIIEFLDGIIDVAYIAESEANALAGDYHFCPACRATDEALDIEF
jgi:uncharacterized metal-binding protein YceD (DUF177 family)